MGRSFQKRFLEHLPKPSLISTFAKHIVNEQRSVNSLETNLEIIAKCKKSLIMRVPLPQALYSLDLALVEFFLFPHMKKDWCIKGHQFDNVEEVKKKKPRSQSFLKIGTTKLVCNTYNL